MYAREIDGQTFTFGVSGKLIMNALVMYDRETMSLWSHFTGDAVQGEMKGTVLEFIPALQTDWETWSQLHPDTKALDKGSSNAYDPYTGYYRGGSAGIIGQTRLDERLPTKEFVVGVLGEDTARAYPFRALNETPVVNDTIGGIPIVVVFDDYSATAAVFIRQLEGDVLTFSLAGHEEGQTPLMRDEETGTVWELLSGKAVDGPSAGKTLEQYPSNYSFWFAWKDYYPDTEIFGQ